MSTETALCDCDVWTTDDVRLCAVHHRYFKGDREFTSVSRITKAVYPSTYKQVKPIVLETARLRGQFVDSYFSEWLKNPKGVVDLNVAYGIIYSGFKVDKAKNAADTIHRIEMLLEWWDRRNGKAVSVQEIVYSEVDGIAGMLDVRTEDYVFDLKCVAKILPDYAAQLGAYSDYSDHSLDVGIIHVTSKKVTLWCYDAQECRNEWRECVKEYNSR